MQTELRAGHYGFDTISDLQKMLDPGTVTPRAQNDQGLKSHKILLF